MESTRSVGSAEPAQDNLMVETGLDRSFDRSEVNTSHPLGLLPNFDTSRIYVDGYIEDPALVNDTNPVVRMDDLLKTFL